MITVDVDTAAGLLTVGVESTRSPVGCPECGVIADDHGRSDVTSADAPCFDRTVRIVWRKRIWCCGERSYMRKMFTQQNPVIVAPRVESTMRACQWTVKRLRHEHAPVAGLARQLGIAWNTLRFSIKPMLQVMADDVTRFVGVKWLGVDKYVQRHVSELLINRSGRGLKQLTGMLDLTPGC